jgi:hypothetical protein
MGTHGTPSVTFLPHSKVKLIAKVIAKVKLIVTFIAKLIVKVTFIAKIKIIL